MHEFTLEKLERGRRSSAGFSLIELLVVTGIIGVLTALVIPAVGILKGAGDVTKTVYDLNGAIELARVYATRNNTYSWVGFFEEGAGGPAGTAGTGRLVVSVVGSRDGTRIYSEASPTALNPAILVQVGKLMRFENVHLDTPAAIAVPRAVVPNADYQVASDAFNMRDGSANAVTFPYPITGSPQYTFTKVIQFNPQGDATRVLDTPARLIELGLRPTRGSTIDTSSANLAVLQITGIGGQSKIYRP